MLRLEYSKFWSIAVWSVYMFLHQGEIWRLFMLNVRDGTEGAGPILADQQ